MKFKVLGTGSYVPDNIVTNDDMAKIVETNDEWITKRVGIKQRHISVDETTSQMAVKAAERAIENSGVKPEDIDMIIAASITPEYANPGVGCMVQKALGLSCPAFDIGAAACSGFIFLIENAAAQFALGRAKKILIVAAERLSAITDYTDRGSCIIFGDGASALVASDEADNLLSVGIHSYGNDDVINIPYTTGTSPYYTGEQVKETFIRMKGAETYRFAVPEMRRCIEEAMTEAKLQDENITWVLTHQANIRIINESKRKLPIAPEKFLTNIDRMGNTGGASVGILLDETNRKGLLKPGDKIIMAAFGGGLHSGSCAIEW